MREEKEKERRGYPSMRAAFAVQPIRGGTEDDRNYRLIFHFHSLSELEEAKEEWDAHLQSIASKERWIAWERHARTGRRTNDTVTSLRTPPRIDRRIHWSGRSLYEELYRRSGNIEGNTVHWDNLSPRTRRVWNDLAEDVMMRREDRRIEDETNELNAERIWDEGYQAGQRDEVIRRKTESSNRPLPDYLPSLPTITANPYRDYIQDRRKEAT